MMLSNNCSETDISFETDLSDYDFVHSPPARDQCKLFHPAGGGIAYNVPAAWLEDPAAWAKKEFWATGSYVFTDTGTTEPELTIEIRGLRESVCNEINKKLGVPDVIIDAINGPSEDFKGQYSMGTLYQGQISGCFKNDEPGVEAYVYYQIVIPR